MSDAKPIATVEDHVESIRECCEVSDADISQRARDRAIAEAAWKLGYSPKTANRWMQRDLDALLGDGEGTG